MSYAKKFVIKNFLFLNKKMGPLTIKTMEISFFQYIFNVVLEV